MNNYSFPFSCSFFPVFHRLTKLIEIAESEWDFELNTLKTLFCINVYTRNTFVERRETCQKRFNLGSKQCLI